MKQKFDFKKINTAALFRAESVVKHYVPDGKLENGEWIARNPNRADKNRGSFSINITTGAWADFATGDKGGDLISYIAYVQKTSQGEAYKQLCHFLGEDPDASTNTTFDRVNTAPVQPAFTAIYPPPTGAANSCPTRHSQLGNCSAYWDYKSEHSALLMRVCRFDRVKSSGERAKEYRPVIYGKRDSQSPRWHWRQLPEGRPLYGLDTLANYSNSTPALLVEGEKACHAARDLFPNYPCLTWSGGSKAISKTDFDPLIGREVWYWPDNDKAGQQSVDALRVLLNSVDIIGFHVLDLTIFSKFIPDTGGELGLGPANWPEKADAFDACEQGWTAQHFEALEARKELLVSVDRQQINEAKSISIDCPSSTQPFGYRVDDSGVWIYDAKAERYRRICARLDVIARTRDGNGSGHNWGLLVSFKDHDNLEKQWNIPMRLFATDGGAEVVRGLFDRGLDIDSHRESKRKLLDYLQASNPSNRVGLVYRMGWHEKSFVLPENCLGNSKETLLFYTEGPQLCKLQAKGTVDDWRENICKYCSDNPLALFAISSAFAGPMVSLLGQETMGFHFYGDSSWGKSTLLNLACSVYGNPEEYKKSWRATDNALEGVASAHSDMLLALDEINQVDSRIIGDVVYMLGNGQGKHRASDRGQARDSQHRWKFTFISNGEKTLDQYLAESGKSHTGGMEMRFIGIRATFHESENDAKRLGVFNTSHEFIGGAALSEHLASSMRLYHGSAFVAFLDGLVGELEGGNKHTFIPRLLRSLDKFKSDYLTPNAGGQVTRAASKFALVGVAGEFATHLGLTGWKKGEARAAAASCFNAWMKARGGEGNLEDKQMLDHVRHQILKNGLSKFYRWDEDKNSETDNTVIDSHAPIAVECWGYRRETIDKDLLEGDSSDALYYVFPESFKRDLCKGFDPNRVARLLRDVGALELTESEQKENRLVSKARLPRMGGKPVKVYKVKSSALFDSDNDASQERNPL
ncbi:DUF927 domain-containing protein [Aurantivibrio plasticivorans]